MRCATSPLPGRAGWRAPSPPPVSSIANKWREYLAEEEAERVVDSSTGPAPPAMGTAGMTSLPYDARRQGSVLSSVAARGSRLLQAARTQLWYKALDAVVTAPVRPRASFGASLRLLLDPRQAHYDRVGALVGAAERLLPGTSRRLARALLRPALPLNAGGPS